MNELIGYITGMVIVYGPLVVTTALVIVLALRKYLLNVSTNRVDIQKTKVFTYLFSVFLESTRTRPIYGEEKYRYRTDAPLDLRDRLEFRLGGYSEVVGQEPIYELSGRGGYFCAHAVVLIICLLFGLGYHSEGYSIYNSLNMMHDLVSLLAGPFGYAGSIGTVLLMMHVVTKLIFSVWDKVDAVNAKLSNHIVDKDAHKGDDQ